MLISCRTRRGGREVVTTYVASPRHVRWSSCDARHLQGVNGKGHSPASHSSVAASRHTSPSDRLWRFLPDPTAHKRLKETHDPCASDPTTHKRSKETHDPCASDPTAHKRSKETHDPCASLVPVGNTNRY